MRSKKLFESKKNMDLLFKEVLYLYVEIRGFGILLEDSKNSAIIFTSDYLEHTMLITKEENVVTLKSFGYSKIFKFKTIDDLGGDFDGFEEEDLEQAEANAVTWRVPRFQDS